MKVSKKIESKSFMIIRFLNQIPYGYLVDLTNRFKGLNLIECLKNYGRRFTIYRRQESRSSLRKTNAKGKWLSEEALQIADKRRDQIKSVAQLCPTL